ncbi:hypothetical protein LCGC14_1466870 [marine sediment metagenome]|uniref:Uncharacterized protein n=1 Tax=marine sediment metagenome TaxID=412755 RepID=A0A0F9MFF3_9ZZZZ
MDTFIKDSVENMLHTEVSTTFANIGQRMLHAMLGIADEAGELIKMMLRSTYYNQTINMNDYKDELGDIWWYLCLAVDELAKTENKTPEDVFREILNINKAKLKVRYSDIYTHERARNRDIVSEKTAIHKEAAKTETEPE